MAVLVSFAKRHNRDCSIDSICMKCYQTIASANSVSELANAEDAHVCSPNGEFSNEHVDSQRGTF
jgi:hypothetical protein